MKQTGSFIVGDRQYTWMDGKLYVWADAQGRPFISQGGDGTHGFWTRVYDPEVIRFLEEGENK